MLASATETAGVIAGYASCWEPVWTVVAQVLERALGGAVALGLVAFLFDQVYRRYWRYRRVAGKYHEALIPKRKIRVRYKSRHTFSAQCTENGIAMWTSIFSYDPLTRLGLGNYYYRNGANPNDWGEHRLHFFDREVRGVDRNVGGGKDEVHPIHWLPD